jgi:hypothetical protein
VDAFGGDAGGAQVAADALHPRDRPAQVHGTGTGLRRCAAAAAHRPTRRAWRAPSSCPSRHGARACSAHPREPRAGRSPRGAVREREWSRVTRIASPGAYGPTEQRDERCDARPGAEHEQARAAPALAGHVAVGAFHDPACLDALGQPIGPVADATGRDDQLVTGGIRREGERVAAGPAGPSTKRQMKNCPARAPRRRTSRPATRTDTPSCRRGTRRPHGGRAGRCGSAAPRPEPQHARRRARPEGHQ